MSDLPMSDFEQRLERRIRSYAETNDPVVDADAIAYAAERAAPATTRRWFGAGAGVWVPVLLGLLLVIGAAIFVAGVLVTLNERKPLAANGLIAYDVGGSVPDELGQIHVTRPEGVGDRDVGEGSCPQYLADGSALTYVTGWEDNGLRQEVAFAEADGGSIRDIGPFAGAGIAVSPDGRQLAQLEPSVRASTIGREIWLTDVADGSRRRLVPAGQQGDVTYTSLAWSVDGESIAFAVMQLVESGDSSGRYRREIDVVDVATGVVRVVSDRPGTDDVAISWSSDSESVAYLGLPDGSPLPALPVGDTPNELWDLPQDVFVARLDGSGDRNITASPEGETSVAWSPAGSAIAYQDRNLGTLAVAEVGVADSNVTHYSGPPADAYTWSPDGTSLLFAHTDYANGGPEVIRSTLSTVDPRFRTSPHAIVERQEVIRCVTWQGIRP
jgi:dipeptidyl aminopeptidase/acylaminoacyl peptidase